MSDSTRRWPGWDGWAVLVVGAVATVAMVLRWPAGGARWVLLILLLDALYLTLTRRSRA